MVLVYCLYSFIFPSFNLIIISNNLVSCKIVWVAVFLFYLYVRYLLNNKMITHISFEKILPIWRDFLWPNRTSSIDSHSAMDFKGNYDLQNMISTPTFFAYTIDNKIVGVNSGHMCRDNSYRSRGLWVFPEHRGNQIGKQILIATIQQGISEGADYVWSYPKDTSWKTYNSAGFELASDWEKSENGTNAYCKYVIST